MPQSFPFAFYVKDLESTRRFYVQLLGCAGQPGEQATMFLQDASGNAIEMKAFRHPEHVFTA